MKTVDIIGESVLSDYYVTALESLGVNTIKHDPSALTLSGLCQTRESL